MVYYLSKSKNLMLRNAPHVTYTEVLHQELRVAKAQVQAKAEAAAKKAEAEEEAAKAAAEVEAAKATAKKAEAEEEAAKVAAAEAAKAAAEAAKKAEVEAAKATAKKAEEEAANAAAAEAAKAAAAEACNCVYQETQALKLLEEKLVGDNNTCNMNLQALRTRVRDDEEKITNVEAKHGNKTKEQPWSPFTSWKVFEAPKQHLQFELPHLANPEEMLSAKEPWYQQVFIFFVLRNMLVSQNSVTSPTKFDDVVPVIDNFLVTYAGNGDTMQMYQKLHSLRALCFRLAGYPTGVRNLAIDANQQVVASAQRQHISRGVMYREPKRDGLLKDVYVGFCTVQFSDTDVEDFQAFIAKSMEQSPIKTNNWPNIKTNLVHTSISAKFTHKCNLMATKIQERKTRKHPKDKLTVFVASSGPDFTNENDILLLFCYNLGSQLASADIQIHVGIAGDLPLWPTISKIGTESMLKGQDNKYQTIITRIKK
jgi:chemotaxis protein histidine kinase CheA